MLGRAARILFLLPALAAGGEIHGVVLEQASGFPLARARVRLAVLVKDRLEPVATIIASRSGQFTFPTLKDGNYVLSAVRTGYAVSTFGQKKSNSPGKPIAVAGETSVFAELRLQHLAAITGRVLDENYVGLPGILVLAYPARFPLRMAGSGKSDDRGVYRISGLVPGRYFVRSVATELEEGIGLLPTFGMETFQARDGKTIHVDLDMEGTDMNVKPFIGRLSTLNGRTGGCDPGPVLVTLSSDTGRRQVTAPCNGIFQFDQLAQGDYELLAEQGKGDTALAAHHELFLGRPVEQVTLELRPLPVLSIAIEALDRAVFRTRDIPLEFRRKDLAGETEPIQIGPQLRGDQVRLLPGYWEATAVAPVTHYLNGMRTLGPHRTSRAGATPDWYEIYIPAFGATQLQVQFAPRPATLAGKVTAGADAVAGAPVFLLPIPAETRRQTNGLRMLRSDERGQFNFQGLPPGNYFVLSSFDLTDVDTEALAAARAVEVSMEAGQNVTQDLQLYSLP